MDEQNRSPEQEEYTPRPAWQVWGARIGVVVVFLAFLLYCWHIANGGI